ncbi:hypothetical protein TSUD_34510 [Trifolium subterraneum]|uniref:Uncharacterized protein n=1 Tax=Trifolium subterraneum TaxID=3900 RepID=A0A2Z6PFH2_TRISU|nr:hypothetical protein TSUD_34510 [Trifolium subterraneum]
MGSISQIAARLPAAPSTLPSSISSASLNVVIRRGFTFTTWIPGCILCFREFHHFCGFICFCFIISFNKDCFVGSFDSVVAAVVVDLEM